MKDKYFIKDLERMLGVTLLAWRPGAPVGVGWGWLSLSALSLFLFRFA